MFKTKWLLALLCAGTVAQAQQKNPADTLPKRDSVQLIDELKENVLDNIPVVSLDENDMGDGSAQNISSVLTAGRDPFFSAASFNFSPVRFRIRGYEADQFGTYMNGIPMENLDNGFTPWGLWGGLNDVMRNRDLSVGLRPSTFAFGDLGSNTSIDARASKQRAQTTFGYAFSNRNYNHRWNFTHSTGLSKQGWAFTVSGSRRWANEGYVPGTYYDGWSYFLGVDKKLSQRHMLSLVFFGAPTENGRQTAAFQEAMDLAGTNYYNPSWGYQNGKKRNASVGRTNQPVQCAGSASGLLPQPA
ncbi:MAG: Plug domain-containing protein [Chitinophagaceae bacterium]|nr:MAG: Plug domain-containing protein [Chitinophagaceae bacterium]